MFSDIVRRSNIQKFSVRINSECYAVGAVPQVEVDGTAKQVFESTTQISTCSKFGQLLLRGKMFHSELYKRPTKQNSYTVLYQDDNSGLAHGLISYFLLINFQCQHDVDLDCVQCNSQVFAVIFPLIPHPGIKLANDTLTGASVSHIVPYYLLIIYM